MHGGAVLPRASRTGRPTHLQREADVAGDAVAQMRRVAGKPQLERRFLSNVAEAAVADLLARTADHLDVVGQAPDRALLQVTRKLRDAEAGEHVANGWPNTCYGVSKLGLSALTRVLARDEPKIMVNAVDPGWCKTDQNLMQGPVSAERGATTPALLATLPDEQFLSGGLYLEEQEIKWDYSGVTRAL